MNAKIITVWGKNGSGKTTFSVNLALSLAYRNYMVGIISSKLYYGELQGYLGGRVEDSQGTYRVISNGGDTKNMFTQMNAKSSVFFLSPPNDIDAMLLTAVSMDMVKETVEDATMRFDYIIIDGSEELNNPFSSVGLAMAHQIFILHYPSVSDCLWHRSMMNVMNMLLLNDKSVHILNAYDKSCDKMAYTSNIGVKFSYELDYIDKVTIYQNAGTPIYTQKNLATKKYRNMIDKIASLAALL